MQASTTITAIPPLLEKAFAQNIISSLELKLFGLFPNSKKIEVLRLHRTAKAVSLDEVTKLAKKSSNFSHSSKVIIGTKLFEILGFVQCNAKITNAAGVCSDKSFWLLSGSSYIEHPCRLWFGNPTEVWTTVLKDETEFFFVTEITSRVVYVETMYQFGRVIGEDRVLIITPIPLYLHDDTDDSL